MQLTGFLPFVFAALAAAVPTGQSQALDARGFNTCLWSGLGTKAGVTAAAKTIAAKSGSLTVGGSKIVLASATANGQKTTVSVLTYQIQGGPKTLTVTYQQLADFALKVIDGCSYLQCVTLQGKPDCLAGGQYSPPGDLTFLEVHVDGDYNGPVQVITTGPSQ